MDRGSEDERAVVGSGVVDDVVVVVAVAEHELRVVGADAGTDRVRGAEVEGRAVDRGDLAGRDQTVVGRGEVAGVERQLMVKDRAGAFAGEVEVGVIGQVEEVGLVGRGLVVDAELVGVGQGVGDVDGEVAGVALLAVRAGVGKVDADAIRPPISSAAQMCLSKPVCLREGCSRRCWSGACRSCRRSRTGRSAMRLA